MRGCPLSEQLPKCHCCAGQATRWRLPGSPAWGQGADFRTLDEALVLSIWEHDGVPDDAYGTCTEHFHHELDEKGNVVLSAAGRHYERLLIVENKPTRAQRVKARKTEFRLRVFRELGGECGECGEANPNLLRIQWPFRGRPDAAPAGPTERYSWLLDNPDVLRRHRLRCCSHLSSVSDRHREAAVAAYGSTCACGETEGLWVMPQAGTSTPRYPGGGKYGSRDKYRWLVQQGFPTGWVVVCPAHVTR